MRRQIALLCCLLWVAASAQAHVASNGFLDVDVRGRTLTGSVELAVRDVELAVGADANRDGKVTWGELRAAAPQLLDYLAQHLTLAVQGGTCVPQFGALEVNQRVDGTYAWVPFTARCASEVRELEIGYRVL